MKKKFTRSLLPAALAGLLTLAGCGKQASGTMTDRTVTLDGGVYSLELEGLGGFSFKRLDAQVNCGGNNNCLLTVNENVADSITVDVDESAKVIRLSGNCGFQGASVYLQVNADVDSIRASGAYDIVYNAGTELSDIEVDVSGASDITVSGECENVSLHASGGSDIEAFGLKAVNAAVSASGGSDVELYVSGTLKAEASGGSDIIYDGGPADISKNASGGSDIKAK